MEGVTAYQTQIISRMKAKRLKLWTGAERGHQCPNPGCDALASSKAGEVHMLWWCPAATEFWAGLIEIWGYIVDGAQDEILLDKELIQAFFSLQIDNLPIWLLEWGQEQRLDVWECMHEVVNELWAIGCATVLTAIWRWNIELVHPSQPRRMRREEAVCRAKAAVWEAYRRYRLTLYPLTERSQCRMEVVDCCLRRRGHDPPRGLTSADDQVCRVAFFDGGSRGNPGPGGSGSWIAECLGSSNTVTPIWAAATALGNPKTTNNIADFVGLHRALACAWERKWQRIHVVGDSALILGMMRRRKEPKKRTLQHWYRVTRRLADLCRVQSWTYHYRKHNKTADWLENYAMNQARSSMTVFDGADASSAMKQGVEEFMLGDIQQWVTMRTIEVGSEAQRDE